MISSSKNGRLLILILLLFASAEISDIIHRSNLKYTLQTNSLERALNRVEKENEEFLKVLIASRDDLSQVLDRITQYIESGENSLVHYRDNRLQLWTDNGYTVPDTYEAELFGKSIVYLQGGWFIMNKISEGDDTIITLSKIWQSYEIDNEIVKTAYDKRFRMPAGSGISIDPEIGFEVSDRSGNYLFSVTYDEDEGFNTGFIVIPLTLWFLFIVAFVLLVNRLNSYLSKKAYAYLTPLVSLLIFGILYIIIILTGKPDVMVSLDVFSPFRFTLIKLVPSPGHILLLSLIFFYLAWSFYKWFPLEFGKGGERRDMAVLSGYLSISALVFYLYTSLLKVLISGSNINFEIHKVLDIDIFTVVAFLASSLVLTALVIMLLKILKRAAVLSNIQLIVAGGVSSLVLVSILLARGDNPVIQLLFWLALLLCSRIFRDTTSGMINISVVFSLICGGYASYFIKSESDIRETNNLKVLAVNYSTDNDLYAESILDENWQSLKEDTILSALMDMRYFTSEEAGLIYNYLDKKYFNGYWENYERIYTICNYDSELIIENGTESVVDCFGFFKSKIGESVQLFNDSSLVYIENNSGRAYYLGSLFYKTIDGTNNGLFIELINKIKYIQPGYPELLVDKRYYNQALLKSYSIAKYVRDTLVVQSGDFLFNTYLNVPIADSTEFVSFSAEGTDYLIYNFSETVSLVIVKPSDVFLDILVTFTYFFVALFILFFISLMCIHPPELLSLNRLDFRQKMQMAFIVILLGTMISVGGVVVYLSVSQYRQKHLENIEEKLSSVNIELEHKLSGETSLNADWSADGYPTLDDLLIKFSNVFYTDINLFTSEGNLLASSRREVFDKELTGLKMNYFALNALAVSGESRFISQEKIGELTFLSAYVPFYNMDNQLLAYLNLPYFNMQSKLTEEISTLIVAIINFSLILLVISMGFVIYISGRITSPLRMLREGLASVKLGELSKQLEYKGKDEIGELVKQYNKMLMELHYSAIKLARSEREDAWREMAKQIAHEIKNPLTPMKLNVQQLEKSWKDRSEDFEAKLARFTKNQIEQIDNLSSIATEFSNFARMPKASPGKTDLLVTVKNATELFSDIRNIDVTLETNSLTEVIIFADREQLSSMLTNLIRNAVQAIPANRKGVISLDLAVEKGKVLLSVKDNGSGIPEELKDKLFAPNFTTKSSGMGLGLAIVKRIVETANGRIWFDSDSSSGTIFYVEYPLISFK